MKTPTHKKTNIRIISVTTIVLLLVTIGGFFIYKQDLFGLFGTKEVIESSNINNSPPSDEQIKDGVNTKTNSQNNSIDTNLKVNLTSINQTDSKIQIRAMVNAISSQGGCELQLTKDNQTITKTVTLQALPSTSTCMGFDISKTELAAGEWKIKLTITIGSKTGYVEDVVDVKI